MLRHTLGHYAVRPSMPDLAWDSGLAIGNYGRATAFADQVVGAHSGEFAGDVGMDHLSDWCR
jgi:hypothetical protein